jgi:hypothetical protein
MIFVRGSYLASGEWFLGGNIAALGRYHVNVIVIALDEIILVIDRL